MNKKAVSGSVVVIAILLVFFIIVVAIFLFPNALLPKIAQMTKGFQSFLPGRENPDITASSSADKKVIDSFNSLYDTFVNTQGRKGCLAEYKSLDLGKYTIELEYIESQKGLNMRLINVKGQLISSHFVSSEGMKPCIVVPDENENIMEQALVINSFNIKDNEIIFRVTNKKYTNKEFTYSLFSKYPYLLKGKNSNYACFFSDDTVTDYVTGDEFGDTTWNDGFDNDDMEERINGDGHGTEGKIPKCGEVIPEFCEGNEANPDKCIEEIEKTLGDIDNNKDLYSSVERALKLYNKLKTTYPINNLNEETKNKLDILSLDNGICHYANLVKDKKKAYNVCDNGILVGNSKGCRIYEIPGSKELEFCGLSQKEIDECYIGRKCTFCESKFSCNSGGSVTFGLTMQWNCAWDSQLSLCLDKENECNGKICTSSYCNEETKCNNAQGCEWYGGKCIEECNKDNCDQNEDCTQDKTTCESVGCYYNIFYCSKTYKQAGEKTISLDRNGGGNLVIVSNFIGTRNVVKSVFDLSNNANPTTIKIDGKTFNQESHLETTDLKVFAKRGLIGDLNEHIISYTIEGTPNQEITIKYELSYIIVSEY